MTKGVLRGVPLAMQQDGWWLGAELPPSQPQGRVSAQRRWDMGKAALLLLLIALGDLLAWGIVPGVSLAVLGSAIVTAGLYVAWPRLRPRVRWAIIGGAALSLLPLVELVQPLSVLIAVTGLSVVCAALAGLGRRDLIRGALRLWWCAPRQTIDDTATATRALGNLNLAQTDLRALVLGWAVPLFATALFALLLIGANPVLDKGLMRLADWQLPVPHVARIWLWLALAAAIWPVLVAWRMRERLRWAAPARATVQAPGLFNAASVARSLVAFNALFAVQTGMDLLFLYGSAGLPDGISPATYAHRGAYPLLLTALLAGVFAVMARPHLAGRPALRWLMLIWLGQTLALVFASLWRLEAYVEVYGLTRLRLAAFVWMGLVAAGLALVAWQTWRDRPAIWMILRSGALGIATLYICAFVNFDGLIARHNLTHEVQRDTLALCRLSAGALPAMATLWDPAPRAACLDAHSVAPQLRAPQDWREWGFRNWRVRNSLAQIAKTTAAP
ncbi:MAG: DUF4173 domain-containing protein [Pseudomonadota bacterium]